MFPIGIHLNEKKLNHIFGVKPSTLSAQTLNKTQKNLEFCRDSKVAPQWTSFNVSYPLVNHRHSLLPCIVAPAWGVRPRWLGPMPSDTLDLQHATWRANQTTEFFLGGLMTYGVTYVYIYIYIEIDLVWLCHYAKHVTTSTVYVGWMRWKKENPTSWLIYFEG